MSKTQNCACRHRNRHILISFLFLFVSSLTHHRIPLVEGRPISKLIEAPQELGQVEENKVVAVNAARVRQIGSRPPRCERRCSACARCKAVQVPVAPQQRLQNSSHRIMSRSSSSSSSSSSHGGDNGGTTSDANYNAQKKMNNNSMEYYSRSDDFSNYKPMGWKCKCGNFLFNP